MPLSVTFDLGALADPEELPLSGCGCGGACGGSGGCASPSSSPQWARVTGAPQRRAGPVAAPVPLMEGIDPESFGAGRECESYSVGGHSPAEPCGLFCTPGNWREWTEAALSYLDQAEKGDVAGSVALIGKGPRIAHLRFLVQKQEPGIGWPSPVPGVGTGSMLAAGMLTPEELANITTEVRCILEDARAAAIAAGKRVGPIAPAPGEGPAIDPRTPLFDPSKLIPQIPEWVKAAGLVAIVYLLTRK